MYEELLACRADYRELYPDGTQGKARAKPSAPASLQMGSTTACLLRYGTIVVRYLLTQSVPQTFPLLLPLYQSPLLYYLV